MKNAVIFVILLAIPSMVVSETLEEALSRAKAYNQAKRAEREAVTDADAAYSNASEALKRRDLDDAERWVSRLRQIDDKDSRLGTLAKRIAEARTPPPVNAPEPVLSLLELGRRNSVEELDRKWAGTPNKREAATQKGQRPGRAGV